MTTPEKKPRTRKAAPKAKVAPDVAAAVAPVAETPSRDAQWLETRLQQAAALCNTQPVPGALRDLPFDELRLGIDLGTSNVVTMVVDEDGMPRAVRLTEADVVRDGVVYDFFGAVNIVRRHLEEIEMLFGRPFTYAATSYPPGTEPRISVNVIEATGLRVSKVLDEPSAVAHMLHLHNAAVVDIGGGTTGVAVVQNGEVIFSADEPTGGHHISLTLAGGMGLDLPAAEVVKKTRGAEIWPRVRPVFEKMCHIVEKSLASPALKGITVDEMLLSGGSCTLPGVLELFRAAFPEHTVLLPRPPLFITPLAIACSDMTT